ncbi:MAG: DUF3536 domain-containing protein, partial [Chloroflexi bacterium]|nr:DUF3536 domain-containing protein [Chloroflexota bacterium]
MTTKPAQRYVCIHGHFYQPPREDPWLDAVQTEDSAYPYHDWNQRVTAECYAPNAWAHLQDSRGRVERIVNNYERISFNFGPTLLAWLQGKDPEVYRAVLEGDRKSQERYGGHGSAIAQAYNHLIMPLANERDKQTQVAWGVRDFEHRFRRPPEGMWLPETAADTPTLEALARAGIRFTVLEPSQARRIRPLTGGPWTEAGASRLDTAQPYLQKLPSGRSIAIYFYDGSLSRAIAFEGMLHNGETLASRLAGLLKPTRTGPQLAHIATDGESYGHHHKFGDMALAYALDSIERTGEIRLTNYGQHLALHPPAWEVQIAEGASWSCRHGVERWRAGCGCNTGANTGWSQAWRAPLRDALEWLRDTLAPRYEASARRLLKDPWAARDGYVAVVLDRSPDQADAFFAQHARRALSSEQRVKAMKLLEMQRHAMLMFTSCGWFFDDPSGIETVQVLLYAARAVQLARDLFEEDFETPLLTRLEPMHSNVPEQGNGRRIYERSVAPRIVDWDRVAAHYAVLALCKEAPTDFYCFSAQAEDAQRLRGRMRKGTAGLVRLSSRVTGESALRAFFVWDEGTLQPAGRVAGLPRREYLSLVEDSGTRTAQRKLLREIPGATCTLESLFEDDRRALVAERMEALLAETETVFRRDYEAREASLRTLAGLRVAAPRDFQEAAEFLVSHALRKAVSDPELPVQRIK